VAIRRTLRVEEGYPISTARSLFPAKILNTQQGVISMQIVDVAWRRCASLSQQHPMLYQLDLTRTSAHVCYNEAGRQCQGNGCAHGLLACCYTGPLAWAGFVMVSGKSHMLAASNEQELALARYNRLRLIVMTVYVHSSCVDCCQWQCHRPARSCVPINAHEVHFRRRRFKPIAKTMKLVLHESCSRATAAPPPGVQLARLGVRPICRCQPSTQPC
jgi:hypothetical protein